MVHEVLALHLFVELAWDSTYSRRTRRPPEERRTSLHLEVVVVKPASPLQERGNEVVEAA